MPSFFNTFSLHVLEISRAQKNSPHLNEAQTTFLHHNCENLEDRQRKINTIERLINPRMDNERRSDISLQISIKESKNLPLTNANTSYFIEVRLDGTIYAKTAQKEAKLSSGPIASSSIFWGIDFNLLRISEATRKVEIMVFEVAKLHKNNLKSPKNVDKKRGGGTMGVKNGENKIFLNSSHQIRKLGTASFDFSEIVEASHGSNGIG